MLCRWQHTYHIIVEWCLIWHGIFHFSGTFLPLKDFWWSHYASVSCVTTATTCNNNNGVSRRSLRLCLLASMSTTSKCWCDCWRVNLKNFFGEWLVLRKLQTRDHLLAAPQLGKLFFSKRLFCRSFLPRTKLLVFLHNISRAGIWVAGWFQTNVLTQSYLVWQCEKPGRWPGWIDRKWLRCFECLADRNFEKAIYDVDTWRKTGTLRPSCSCLWR